ncbi:MAG: signal peptidase I [Actinomycetota bacterium]
MSVEQGQEASNSRDAVGNPRTARWKTISGILSATVLMATGAAATNLRAFSIPSTSMAPTLASGDRVLALSPTLGGAPKRGEIWVFRNPGPGAKLFVKRVVGVPGDTVAVQAGKLRVNGQAQSEPYLEGSLAYETAPVKLGAGQFFVLGDNRNNSNDSHVFGPVGGETFVGKVEFRYWPPNRTGGL